MIFIKKIVKFMALWMGYLLHHNRKSKVLYYHDIGVQYTNMGTPFDLFIDHIRIIKERGFEIVTNVTNENNQVMIAFDDGWRGIYDNKQLFVDYGFFPTVFIAVNLIGAPGYMNEKEIKELYDLGFIFESHTWTHTGLHTHHGDSLIKETEYAKLKLEEMFNKPFDDICFPQGMFSEEAIIACKKAGYKKMYSCISGNYFDYIEHNLICRNLVQYTPVNQLKLVLEGNSIIQRMRDISTLFVGKWPY